jgi:urease accessory protein
MVTMDTGIITTMIIADPGLIRLLQLTSPSLPTGGFTYSQGIEWAVETGWIRTAADLEAWVADQLTQVLARVDLPILARLYEAAGERDAALLETWIDRLIAARETAELRLEESNRGRALTDLLVAWELPGAAPWRAHLVRSQAAGLAFAAVAWEIPSAQLAQGYAWAWTEGLVLAGIKCVPLGQTQGQQLLARLAGRIPTAVELALSLEDAAIGASCPALAIASSRHETQYTRLFRS